MIDAEYEYHRKVAVQVSSLGWCSRTKEGLIKVEGYAPVKIEDLPIGRKRAFAVAAIMSIDSKVLETALRQLGI